MSKGKHLTLDDRTTIQSGLKDGLSFKQIAAELEKDPSTISKEIRAHVKKSRVPPFVKTVFLKSSE